MAVARARGTGHELRDTAESIRCLHLSSVEEKNGGCQVRGKILGYIGFPFFFFRTKNNEALR